MKISFLLAVLSLGYLVAACSLDSPFSSVATNPLLNTGRDARVYNGSTGNWEWPSPTPRPKQKPTPKPTATPALVKSTPVATPTPAKKAAAFVQATTPQPTVTLTDTTPAPVKPATPTPVAKRAIGVLNMETGKIEWREAGPATPTPKKTKATPTPKATVSS